MAWGEPNQLFDERGLGCGRRLGARIAAPAAPIRRVFQVSARAGRKASARGLEAGCLGSLSDFQLRRQERLSLPIAHRFSGGFAVIFDKSPGDGRTVPSATIVPSPGDLPATGRDPPLKQGYGQKRNGVSMPAAFLSRGQVRRSQTAATAEPDGHRIPSLTLNEHTKEFLGGSPRRCGDREGEIVPRAGLKRSQCLPGTLQEVALVLQLVVMP
jgi:hypothetical protein